MEFNPENRPGQFLKNITVISNSDTKNDYIKHTEKLTIKGNVIAEKNKLRSRIGDLRLKDKFLKFEKIKDSRVVIDSLEIQNASVTPLKIVAGELPELLKIRNNPLLLQPRERSYLIIELDPRHKKDYGEISLFLPLKLISEDQEKEAKLRISANIEEDFSDLSEENLQNAPRISFTETEIEMGKIKKNEEKKINIEFRNKGKRNLSIRSVNVQHGFKVIDFDKEVAPDGTGIIEIVFQSSFLTREMIKNITVISNDPENPVQVITLKGTGIIN